MGTALPTVTAPDDGLSTLFKALFGSASAGLLGTNKTGKTQSNAITDAITKAITDSISKSVADTVSDTVAKTTQNSVTDQVSKSVADTTSVASGTNTSKAVQDTSSDTKSASTVANTADIGSLRDIISTYSADNMRSSSQAGVDYQTDRLLQGPLLNFINAQNQSGGYGGVNPYLSQIVTDAAGQGAALSNQAVIQGGTIAGNAAAAIAGATKTTTGTGVTNTTGTNVANTTGSTVNTTAGTTNTTGKTTGNTNITGTNVSNTTGKNTTNTNSNVTANTNSNQVGSVVGSSTDLTKTPLDLTGALKTAGIVLAPSAITALGKALGIGAAPAAGAIVPDGGWTDALGNVFDKTGQVVQPAGTAGGIPDAGTPDFTYAADGGSDDLASSVNITDVAGEAGAGLDAATIGAGAVASIFAGPLAFVLNDALDKGDGSGIGTPKGYNLLNDGSSTDEDELARWQADQQKPIG